MKSIAIALIWVALYFGPDIHFLIHKEKISDNNGRVHALIFLFICFVFLASLIAS